VFCTTPTGIGQTTKQRPLPSGTTRVPWSQPARNWLTKKTIC